MKYILFAFLLLSLSHRVDAQQFVWHQVDSLPSIYTYDLLAYKSKLIAAFGDNYGLEGGLLQTSDKGATWENIGTTGLWANSVRQILADSSGALYASAGYTVFKSLNEGDTWRDLFEDPQQPYYLHDVSIDGNILLATAHRRLDSDSLLVIRSTDRGDTWQEIRNNGKYHRKHARR